MAVLKAEMKKIKVDANAPAAGHASGTPPNDSLGNDQKQQLDGLKEKTDDLQIEMDRMKEKSEGDIKDLKEENARLKAELEELKKIFFNDLANRELFKEDDVKVPGQG